jgi:hypothetical protein
MKIVGELVSVISTVNDAVRIAVTNDIDLVFRIVFAAVLPAIPIAFFSPPRDHEKHSIE